jgi:glycosyltransferase involved in cell wall biosynthesis
MRTGLVMGIHIDFERGIKKYGSVEKMPQYPVIERFSREGEATVFSIDKKNYTDHLPNGTEHISMNATGKASKVRYVLTSWLLIGLMARKRKTDYLYYFSGSSIYSLPFANRLSGAKSILFYGCMLWSSGQSFYGQKKLTNREAFTYVFELFALRSADYIITGTSDIFDFLRYSFFKGQILPMRKFVPYRKPTNQFKRNPKRVIFVGHLEPIKDPITLITAFTNNVNDKDAELVLCGDGSLRLICETMSMFDSRIKVLGQRSDIPDQLAKAGIFVNCSLYEAQSDSLVEAMFSALPVIATDVGGNPDLVTHGTTGIVTEPGNPVKIGHWIKYFIENPEEARIMGEQGKNMAFSDFELNKNLEKLIEIMKEME